MNSREIIKLLNADGWTLARVKGSHHQFTHPDKPGLVTVKHPDGDIPLGTLRNIERQAGWRGQPITPAPAKPEPKPESNETTATRKGKAS
jgi:predicted RNA binding protein YcfA (HicA-like mRNA interferase family)